MKICLVQTRPVKGDVEANIERHRSFVERAASEGADFVLFPELSLTGYEPSMARDLTMEVNDARLEAFQRLSDAREIVIAMGAPTKATGAESEGQGDRRADESTRPRISLILFQPDQARRVYSKRYLHEDEEPFFGNGSDSPIAQVTDVKVGLAICYELIVPEHAEAAAADGAEVYLASAAKLSSGVEEAHERLEAIARQYGIPALLVNSVGPQDTFVGAGGSAAWNERGELVAQLDAESEGLLIFDTDSQQARGVNPVDEERGAEA